MDILMGTVKGQELRARQGVIASDSRDFLQARVIFHSDHWDGVDKWVQFSKGEHVYRVHLVDGVTPADAHLNLTAGTWTMMVFGEKQVNGVPVQVITTNPADIYVVDSGLTEGEPFPEIPASEAEQILATANRAEERATQAEDKAGSVVARADAGEFNGKDGDPGEKGDPGSDAEVTAENIQRALGYMPSDIEDVNEIKGDLTNLRTILEQVRDALENGDIERAIDLLDTFLIGESGGVLM